MKSKKTAFLLILLAAFSLPGATPAGSAGLADSLAGPLVAEVLDVIDGDTLAVRVRVWLDQDIVTRVRLLGVDTPELRGKCAREREMAGNAKQALVRLLGQKNIRLFDVRHDKYAGRVLARAVTAEGVDVSKFLIEKGMARPYAGQARAGWC